MTVDLMRAAFLGEVVRCNRHETCKLRSKTVRSGTSAYKIVAFLQTFLSSVLRCFQVPYFTGSYVAYNIAQHLPALATHMGGSDVQAFLLMLAPLVQVSGRCQSILQ